MAHLSTFDSDKKQQNHWSFNIAIKKPALQTRSLCGGNLIALVIRTTWGGVMTQVCVVGGFGRGWRVMTEGGGK